MDYKMLNADIRTSNKQAKRDRLIRKKHHRWMIHGFVIVAIALSLFSEGGKLADWLFVALSVMCETA